MLRLALWVLTHTFTACASRAATTFPSAAERSSWPSELTLLEAVLCSRLRPTGRSTSVAEAKPFAAHGSAGSQGDCGSRDDLIMRIMAQPGLTMRTANGFLRKAAAAFAASEVVCLAGEAASDVLENPAERGRWEEFLRESNAPIVMVSVRDAAAGPLQEDAARSLFSSSSRGRVTVKFGAPVMPGDGAWAAQALRSLQPATAARFAALQPRRLEEPTTLFKQLHLKKRQLHLQEFLGILTEFAEKQAQIARDPGEYCRKTADR